MRQDNKKNSKKIFYLNDDNVYNNSYKRLINNVKDLGNGYYSTTMNRVVLDLEQKHIYAKEEVLLKEIKKLSDNIIILNIVNYEG